MIDTITVEIDQTLIRREHYKCIKKSLTKHQNLWAGYDPEVHVGKLNHMRVQFYDHYIKVIGSVPKEIYGNNVQIPSRNEVCDFFSLAHAKYGLPMHLGRLTKVEFGFNFFMDHPIKNYLNCLQETPGFSFSRFKNSVYYHKSNYSLSFYDKGKEIQSAMRTDPSLRLLPVEILDANILRYEVRCKARLYQLFDFDVIKPVLIHSTTFRNQLYDLWQKAYWSIEKSKALAFDPSLNTLPKLKPQIELKGIESIGGLNYLMEQFKEMKSTDQIKQKQYDSLSSWVKRI